MEKWASSRPFVGRFVENVQVWKVLLSRRKGNRSLPDTHDKDRLKGVYKIKRIQKVTK